VRDHGPLNQDWSRWLWRDAHVKGTLTLAIVLLVGSVTVDGETCKCASCGAAICRAACRTNCNKCCRCCIYFEMRVGRRAASGQLGDSDALDISDASSMVDRRSRLVSFGAAVSTEKCHTIWLSAADPEKNGGEFTSKDQRITFNQTQLKNTCKKCQNNPSLHRQTPWISHWLFGSDTFMSVSRHLGCKMST